MKDCVHEMGICYLWILSSDKQKKLKLAYLLIIIDFFPRLCYHDLMIVVIPKIITQNVCTIVGSIF